VTEPPDNSPERTNSCRRRARAGRASRLKRRTDITRVFQDGRRAGDQFITLRVIARGDSSECARLAVAVSSRHGNAVKRNRIKRLCREAFRLTRAELPRQCDYVIQPRIGAKLTVAAVQASIKSLASRLADGGGLGGPSGSLP